MTSSASFNPGPFDLELNSQPTSLMNMQNQMHYYHCVYAVCAKVLSANRHGRMPTNNTNFSHVFTENKATLHIGKAIIRMVYS